jgi:hypothetical protein
VLLRLKTPVFFDYCFQTFIDEIIIKYALKGADSVHLSSALWLKKAMKQDLVFVASDLELIKAAKAEKLRIFNPVD